MSDIPFQSRYSENEEPQVIERELTIEKPKERGEYSKGRAIFNPDDVLPEVRPDVLPSGHSDQNEITVNRERAEKPKNSGLPQDGKQGNYSVPYASHGYSSQVRNPPIYYTTNLPTRQTTTPSTNTNQHRDPLPQTSIAQTRPEEPKRSSEVTYTSSLPQESKQSSSYVPYTSYGYSSQVQSTPNYYSTSLPSHQTTTSYTTTNQYRDPLPQTSVAQTRAEEPKRSSEVTYTSSLPQDNKQNSYYAPYTSQGYSSQVQSTPNYYSTSLPSQQTTVSYTNSNLKANPGPVDQPKNTSLPQDTKQTNYYVPYTSQGYSSQAQSTPNYYSTSLPSQQTTISYTNSNLKTNPGPVDQPKNTTLPQDSKQSSYNVPSYASQGYSSYAQSTPNYYTTSLPSQQPATSYATTSQYNPLPQTSIAQTRPEEPKRSSEVTYTRTYEQPQTIDREITIEKPKERGVGDVRKGRGVYNPDDC